MTHTLQAISWTLIHFLWQAAMIAAAYRAVVAVLARRSSQTRYVVALSSMLLMLALAFGTFMWELHSDVTPPATLANAASNLTAMLTRDYPHVQASGARAPDSILAQPESAHVTLSDLFPWIDGLWLAGVFVLTVRSLGGWWQLRRLHLSSVMEPPPAVQAALRRVSAGLGLKRDIALRLSRAIESPLTIGALRAVVLLPLSAITALSPDELEVVLAHELAHIRRADFFWNILQTVAETLFFFHPAVWWISSRIRHERELCCDDLALTVCPNPVVYAHALYRLEEHRAQYLRLTMALDGHGSRQTLLMRIARILGEPMTRIPSPRLRPFSLSAACAGLVVLLLPVPHLLASLNPLSRPNVSRSVQALAPAPVPVAANTEVAGHTANPSPSPSARASVEPDPIPESQEATRSDDKVANSSPPHGDYIDRMKAAGYDVDLDKLLAMKIQDVTPEYAHAMANAGFGKPSADQLISCKIHGVTPEYVAQLKQQGFEIHSLEDAISFRIFEVTPEFASGMNAAGFKGLTTQQLLSMRAQGVTPEFASHLKSRFPNATAEDLIKARIFHIDDQFIAQAERHGFNNLPFDKLVQLRISGILDDESVKP
jgi:beta-lactamase regulating signal transducer with metallopeptidase domain